MGIKFFYFENFAYLKSKKLITPESVDNLLAQVRVEEVVGDYVNLKKRGINYVGLCPFHNERTPSFTVSASKGLFKCFGCGKGGSAVTFLMEMEHFTYPEALRHLARKYNIDLIETNDGKEDEKNRLEKESLYIITAQALQHYVHNLFDTAEGQSIGLSYFEERGFRRDIIEKFQLGYALENREAFTSDAVKSGFDMGLLKKAGVTTENGKDFIFGRVIFPIHNLSGKPIAFAGRVLKKDIQPKYLNSPETEIYAKSKTLYGLYLARTAIRKNDDCFLVEGYTDVISLHQAGVENVVASSGTSLTTDHLKVVKRFTDNITLLYDGDAAGVKATLRGMELALEQDINVRIVTLPAEDDPDSFIRKVGLAGFNSYVEEKAENFLLYKARTLLKGANNDPIRKTEAVKGLAESLALMPDPLKRSIFIKECARHLDVDEGLLTREVNSLVNKKYADTLKRTEEQIRAEEHDVLKEEIDNTLHAEQVEAATEQLKEFEVIKNLIEYGHKNYPPADIRVSLLILKEIAQLPLVTPLYNKVVNLYQNKLDKGEDIDYHQFLNDPDIEMQRLISDIITPKYVLNSDWKNKGIIILNPDDTYAESAERSLLYLKYYKMQKVHKELEQKLKHAQTQEEEREYLEMFKELQLMLRELRTKQGNIIRIH